MQSEWTPEEGRIDYTRGRSRKKVPVILWSQFLTQRAELSFIATFHLKWPSHCYAWSWKPHLLNIFKPHFTTHICQRGWLTILPCKLAAEAASRSKASFILPPLSCLPPKFGHACAAASLNMRLSARQIPLVTLCKQMCRIIC